jgi:methylenetetrahydrofolate reductase (NADPH)
MTTPQISFEFFPSRNEVAASELMMTAQTLARFAPRFASVTYGAGGTTQQATLDTVAALRQTTPLRVAAHLTCVGASREETLAAADQFAAAGVTDIVALRGDPPKGAKGFTPHPDGFASSVELIAALAGQNRFTLRVGAYPEKHPDSATAQADIDWLKRKLDAGADEAITQFFFEAETFLRFRDRCAAAGITAPIIPGILPVENWQGVRGFAARCGTSVPAWLAEAFERADRENRSRLFAIAQATDLCSELLDEGVEALHFYTLNRADLTTEVCRALGLGPSTSLRNVA